MAGSRNVRRLEQAGLVDGAQLDETHKRKIESLSDDEVDTLIRVKEKLGFSGKMHDEDEITVDTIF